MFQKAGCGRKGARGKDRRLLRWSIGQAGQPRANGDENGSSLGQCLKSGLTSRSLSTSGSYSVFEVCQWCGTQQVVFASTDGVHESGGQKVGGEGDWRAKEEVPCQGVIDRYLEPSESR